MMQKTLLVIYGMFCTDNTLLQWNQSFFSIRTTLKTSNSNRAAFIKGQQAEQAGKSDIDQYLEEGTLRVSAESTKDSDWLFKWWDQHKEQYPRMAKAARDYLAIPASEVSVERLFSSGRDMIGLQRFSLSSETMRQPVLLRDAILKGRPRG
jgi:hypothetical protein